MNQAEIQQVIQSGESEKLEFKRSFQNEAIETLGAFANSRGGILLIGVDNDGTPTGLDIKEETIQQWINEIKNKTAPSLIPDVETLLIDEKQIVVLRMLEYPIKPVSVKGRYYKRVNNSNHQMSISEISNEHLKTMNSSWDYYADANHNIEHISLEKVEKYLAEYEKWNRTKIELSPLEFLNKKGILRDKKLTFGAYLLFVSEHCSISDLQIGRFKSDTKIIDSLSLNTDIFTELDEIIAFIRKHLMVEFIITGKAQREEKFDYPEEAIREIVINMLIHRDYRQSSGSIIKIFDDRIEFYNPGGLYGDLTIKDLLSLNYYSQVRNKLIADAFREIGKIEKYGTGMRRIFLRCNEHGIIPPVFNSFQNGFEVILYKKKILDTHKVQSDEPLNGPLNEPQSEPLNDRQKLIIESVKMNNRITIIELSQKYGVGRETIKRDLKKLKENGMIQRIGPDKTGYWKLIND
jgi:ATP-dependent DNA helicase RecG